MKKNLIVLQDGAKDCGAACLRSIIQYYGGNVTLERLIELTKTTKEGTTFYNLKEASEEIGLATRSYRVDDIEKIKEINIPFICQITKNNYTHFIVVYKIKDNKLLIMDPSIGKQSIDIFDFNNIWTGNIMLFEKVSTLPLEEDLNITNRLIKEVLKNNKGNIIFVMILSLISTILSCLVSLYSQIIFDKIIDTELNNLIIITLTFSILYIIKNITNYIRNHILIYISQKLDINILLNTFTKVVLLPYNYYKNRRSSEVLSKINDLSYIKNFISKIIVTTFLDFLLLMVATITIYYKIKEVLIIFIIAQILYILIVLIFNNYIKNITIKRQEATAILNNTIIESVSTFETIKGLNIEDNIIYKFSKDYSSLLNITFDIDKLNNLLTFLKEMIINICLITVDYYIFKNIMNGISTTGDYLTITILSSYLIYPISNIMDLSYEYHYIKNSIKRANTFFEVEAEKIHDKRKLIVNGNIKITNLKYTFNNKYYVLNDINLFIKNNDRVLILGSSGSGKSTILKLLYKYLEADRKTIYINGYDINDYSLSDIRESITYVSQNELLFNDTIRNNIILGRDVSEIDYLNICKILHIDDIVKDSIQGYDYVLEENGINLSGGQRQRIILARSLLKNSNIIMIDEGFNQIDITLEREILQDIFTYYHNKTFIIVSHCKENSDLYNRIIKIKNGVVQSIEEVNNE